MRSGCCGIPGSSGPGGGRPTRAAGRAGRTGRRGPRLPRSRLECPGRTARSSGEAAVVPGGVQAVDLALQVGQVLERLVDAGEADIGDLVEPTQALHCQRADPLRGHLGDTGRAQLDLDRIGGLLGRLIGDGPPREGLAQAAGQLVPVELLATTVALDHDQAGSLGPLVGGEAHAARGTLAPAPDRGGVIEVTRVDDTRLAVAALWTAHPAPCCCDHNGLWYPPNDTTRYGGSEVVWRAASVVQAAR